MSNEEMIKDLTDKVRKLKEENKSLNLQNDNLRETIAKLKERIDCIYAICEM